MVLIITFLTSFKSVHPVVDNQAHYVVYQLTIKSRNFYVSHQQLATFLFFPTVDIMVFDQTG